MNKKIQVVDLVRTFSILAVWFFHLNLSHVAVLAKPGPLVGRWHIFCINGAYGVPIFFVVSGFLITRLIANQPKGLFKPDFKGFYSRRAGRILPLLFLVLLLGVGVLLWPLAPSNQLAFCLKNQQAFFGPVFWGSLLTFSFNWYRGFIAVVHDYGLHWDILWSLSIEEQFYFFYPLSLALLVKLRNLYRFLLVFIVLGPLMNAIGVLIFPNVNYWFMNSFSQFDLIAMGCLLYLVTERYKNLLRNNKNACFFFCLAGGFMVLRTFLNIPTELDYARRIFGYFSVGAGTFLFLLGGLHLKVFDSKYLAPLALPGKMSYGGYLLHPAILYFAWPWLSGKGEWVVFPMFCAIALGVTWLSYRFYELPANQWVRRRLNK